MQQNIKYIHVLKNGINNIIGYIISKTIIATEKYVVSPVSVENINLLGHWMFYWNNRNYP